MMEKITGKGVEVSVGLHLVTISQLEARSSEAWAPKPVKFCSTCSLPVLEHQSFLKFLYCARHYSPNLTATPEGRSSYLFDALPKVRARSLS